MPTTRINCPNCRQPIMAEVDQVFDTGVDPSAKQRLLSGRVNFIQCPNCGYQGMLATPVVYHDPNKELLLTYFPPEANLPLPEQERVLGGIINQIVKRLSNEQRKGYLLRPQPVLTMQGMAERILETDGITKEMIQAQQQRLSLLQRLITASSDDIVVELAKQESNLLDRDFYALLNRLIETSMMGGDEQGARRLGELQQTLLPLSEAGRELQEQSQQVQAAVKALQDAGKDLNREKLLELVTNAPNETQVSVMVSLTRQAIDYQFFQLLTEKIDRAQGEERARLEQLRKDLLEMTQEIDRQIEARREAARQNLEEILKVKDPLEALQQNLDLVDEYFVQVLNSELAIARQKADLDRSAKINSIISFIQKASQPPKEFEMIEELIDIEDEKTRKTWLEANREHITPEFVSALTSFLAQTQDNQDQELYQRLQDAYRSVLRFSMQNNLG